MLMKEAVVRAVANLLCAIIIAISIFIGFGMLWEQDQLEREQREKHHREQKNLMSALIAVIRDQSSESDSEIIDLEDLRRKYGPVSPRQLSLMRLRSSDVQQVGVAVAALAEMNTKNFSPCLSVFLKSELNEI